MQSSDRYKLARQLLKANRVLEAREVLVPIQHEAQAADWLQKIDAHLAKRPPREAPVPARTRWPSVAWVVGMFVVAVLAFGAGLVVGGYALDLDPAPTLEPLQSVLVVTATPRPVTATAPATETLVPTATHLPTDTPVVTSSPEPSITPTLSDASAMRDRWNRTPLPSETAFAVASGDVGQWHYSSETSALDDSTRHVLSLAAESSIRAWLRSPTPLLAIRCQDRQYDVLIFVDTQLDSTLDDEVFARVRYGDRDPVSLFMSESTTGEAMFFPDARFAIRSLLLVDRLVVGFTPFNANPVEAIFDLTGLNTAIQPLFEACGDPVTGTG